MDRSDFSSRRQRFRRNTCPEDYMYDSASRRCYACSEICIVPDYFCRTKCPGYYYRNVVTLPTNYASISLSQDRLSVMVEQRSQSPLQKPLFWASMACFFVTIVSTVGIIVICAMHWRKFVFCLRQSRGPVGRRSRTSAVDVPCLLGAKKDPSSDSSQSKTIPSCKDMQAKDMWSGQPPPGHGCFKDGLKGFLESPDIFLVADDVYLSSGRAHPSANDQSFSSWSNTGEVQIHRLHVTEQLDCEQLMGLNSPSSDYLVVNLRLRADDELDSSETIAETSVKRLSVSSIAIGNMNPSQRSSSDLSLSQYASHFTLTDMPLVHVPGSRFRVPPSQCKEVYMPISFHSHYRMR